MINFLSSEKEETVTIQITPQTTLYQQLGRMQKKMQTTTEFIVHYLLAAALKEEEKCDYVLREEFLQKSEG